MSLSYFEPLYLDNKFDFLQTFCMRQGRYRINKNIFPLVLNLTRLEILSRKPQNGAYPKLKITDIGTFATNPVLIGKSLHLYQ